MLIIIGSTVLDDSYAPYVNIGYEYYKTDTGEIIGGVQILTVTGVVTIPDTDSAQTGSIVMRRLKIISNLGQKIECVNIQIPGAESKLGKVTNVTIDQGSDPSWVNQGAFSIEVKCPLNTIPHNSLNIVADDCVREVSRSQSIEMGEESHGGFFSPNAIKSYVKFSSTTTVTCENFCKSITANGNDKALAVMKRIYSCAHSDPLLRSYDSYRPFLQSRSLQLGNGTVTFTCTMILLPPASTAKALVDLQFEENVTYIKTTPQRIRKTSGTVTGLVSVPWSDIVTLPDVCAASKYANADSAYNIIAKQYKDLIYWTGTPFDAKNTTCPTTTPPPGGMPSSSGCSFLDNINSDNNTNNNPKDCLIPKNSTTTKQYTDGIISFIFEWGPKNSDGSDGCDGSGGSVDTVIEKIEASPSLVYHVLPGRGTLIQNLMCLSAEQMIITTSRTNPNGSISCVTLPATCKQPTSPPVLPGEPDNWRLIEHTKNTSSTSYTEKRHYIKCNP
jgi:hypothetical protein